MSRGFEPRWDLDLRFGEAGEALVRTFFGWLMAGDPRLRVEVKSKRYVDDWFYVETEHRPPGHTGYVPSGISTTSASVWVVAVPRVGYLCAFPTVLIRRAVELGMGRECAESDGDCPTRGRLLRPALLLNLRREGTS